MLHPEMIAVFDWSEGNRRLHYGRLINAREQMNALLDKIRGAQGKDGFLDLAVRDRVGEYWIALTRPGMPDSRPNFPRRDLDLMEYLIEWAAGVKNHAIAELMEMDERYPELHNLGLAELMPAKLIYRRPGRPNRLKRWLQRIFEQ